MILIAKAEEMNQDFSLTKECDYHIVRKLSFPRFEAVIDLNKSLPEIKEIKYFEKCNADELENVIRDAGDFIASVHRQHESCFDLA